MPATLIQQAETAWNNTTTPKATPSFDVLAGDWLMACGGNQQNLLASTDITVSNSGTALTWTRQQVVTPIPEPRATVWTAPVLSDASGMAVSFARDSTATSFGGICLTFRGANGPGASAKANLDPGVPSVNLTTLTDGAVVVVFNLDKNAIDGSGRVWLEGAGPLTEITYSLSIYGVYVGYHANVATAGAYTFGLAAPAGQQYSIIAVELQPGADPPVPEQTNLITLTGAE